MSAPAPLPADALRWRCRPDEHRCFEEDARCEPDDTVGQARAVDAITLGLAMRAPGYNVFVTGLGGSGRTHTIESLLRKLPTPNRRTVERVYVHNFDHPTRPRLVELPAGGAKRFAEGMKRLIADVKLQIPRALEHPTYKAERDALAKRLRERERALFEALDRELSADGLAIVSIGDGSMQAIMPLVDGKPLPFELLRAQESKPPAEIAALEAKAEGHKEAFDRAVDEGRRLHRDALAELRALEKSTLRAALEGLVGDLVEELGEAVRPYLEGAREALVEGARMFLDVERADDLDTSAFEVNIVQDTPEAEAPIVIERHPSYSNLFGAIDRDTDGHSDFHMIHPGSLLRADGGFLVLYAHDLLVEPGAYRALLRTLRAGSMEMQNPDSVLLLAPSMLKPDPIPIDVKVVLVGEDRVHELLSVHEEHFAKVFKIKAEFDTSVERNGDGVGGFAAVVRSMADREGLLPVSPDALAGLVEIAVRLAGRQSRISTRFGEIGDLVREADYFARDLGASKIDAAAVDRAWRARRRRVGLLDERLERALLDGRLLVDTSGERIAQINGLAVYTRAGHAFGTPARISASVGAGKGGLINIEREAELSGPHHDKGVLILGGYLRQRYGRERPLALTASIAFEQSYGGVDGDSASLAELYALLSALAQLPIRQSVAITGSMNQLGDAQAIGGVNEKIEGFFRLCERRGFGSGHAVIIPAANAPELMLEEEVVDAVREGRFSIYTVESVDDAIPILFGLGAAAVHSAVGDRLAALREAAS